MSLEAIAASAGGPQVNNLRVPAKMRYCLRVQKFRRIKNRLPRIIYVFCWD